MSKPAPSITLAIYIDGNDQLVATFQEPGLEPMPLRPERGLQDLVGLYPDADSITVEIKDFFQRGTVFEVYGLILEDDGRSIAAYWTPTGTGQKHTFQLGSAAQAGKTKLVIGAIPRRRDVSVPAPLAPRAVSGSGPFPEETGDPKGSGK